MAPPSRLSRSRVAAAIAALAVGILAIALFASREREGDTRPQPTPPVANAPPATPPARAVEPPPPRSAPPEAAEADADTDPLGDLARAEAWAAVDLDAVRDAMPNNLYWELSVPTTDAALLREREDRRAHWNQEYGKVLSNTATVEEVDAYYAHRHRLSADYVQFTSYLLDHYDSVLPERDIGMLEMARELHLARLEELPRRHAEALERREAHAAAREEWLRDQALFDGDEPGDAGSTDEN
jgi:hypothetical protein